MASSSFLFGKRASSSSITQLLLLNCCKLLNVSLPVPLSLSLHSSITPTSVFNGGNDASKKINDIFSKHALFPYQVTPLINNNPFAARSVHTTTPTMYPRYKSKHFDHLRYVLEHYEFEKNPYLTTGPEKFCNVEEDEDALYARLDMPGIVKEGLELLLVNIGSKLSLYISGDECASKSKFQAEEWGASESRSYSTTIAVPDDKYRTDRIRALLKNGVLRIVVPKIKNGERQITKFETVTVEDLPDQQGCGSLTLSSHVHGSHTLAPTLSGGDTLTTESNKAKYIKVMDNFLSAVSLLRNNIFIVKGSKKILSNDPVGGVNYLRLDMPGVGKDGVKIWLEGDHFLCFEGVEDEDKDLRFDKETQLRKYEGCVFVKKPIMKACFENGILRVSMPYDVEAAYKKRRSESTFEEFIKKDIGFVFMRSMGMSQQQMDDCRDAVIVIKNLE